MVETGWLSSYGELLNVCCVNCGVWLSIDDKNRFHEFDGLPHRCTAVQATTLFGVHSVSRTDRLHNAVTALSGGDSLL